MGTKLFLDWDEAFHAGPETTGGKGWNLGRLARYGFPVPAGGVLTTESYLLFIKQNGLGSDLHSLSREITAGNLTDESTREQLARLREKITQGTLPATVVEAIVTGLQNAGLTDKPVAVRSSASLEDSGQSSFAGIHESFLNVCGTADIIDAVKRCYASLWTERAVAYRSKMNIPGRELLPAVVIMAMVDARAAGIGFTCDPRTGRQDTIVINANFGLGESVVGGLVEPDEYHLDTGTFVPLLREKHIGQKEGRTMPRPEGGTTFLRHDTSGDINPDDPTFHKQGESQVLSDENIVRLAHMVLRVYEALGEGEKHQDVEWVFNGEKFFLVQARPVTSLPRYTYPALRDQPDYWSNANIKEALPMVQSALNRRIVNSLFNILVTVPFKASGYPLLPGLKYNRFFQGRMYINASVMQWEFYDALGITPDAVNQAAGGYQPEIKITESEEDKKRADRERNRRKLKLAAALLKTRRTATRRFSQTRRTARNWLSLNLAELSDAELLDAARRITEQTIAFAPTMGLLINAMGLPFYALTTMFEKFYPGRGNAMANALMLGQGNITSAEQGYRLYDLAAKARMDPHARRFLTAENFRPRTWQETLPESSEFKQEFRAYLEEFGHRAVYEGELSNPRWREDPTYLLEVIRSLLAATPDVANIRKVQREKRAEAVQKLKREVSLPARVMINWWARQAVRGAELREQSKSELVRLAEPLRYVALEIGNRLVKRGLLSKGEDVFHCSWPDLWAIMSGAWDGRGLSSLVEDRKKRKEAHEAIQPPDIIVDEQSSRGGPTEPNTNGQNTEILAGTGVATGRATGTARLVQNPNQGGRLNLSEILVAPSTDPGWTPLFIKAAGLVMETGGSLSHGAVVAREFGIPAVVNLPGAMSVIKDGQTITVDGDEGKVYLQKNI